LSSSQATGYLYKYWFGPRSGATGWKRILLRYERNLHPIYPFEIQWLTTVLTVAATDTLLFTGQL